MNSPSPLSYFSLLSKRLVLSYVFDWVVIIAIAAVSWAFANLSPFHRPFSLLDLSISFPFDHHEQVPTWLLGVIALVVPAAVIFFVSLILVPGPTADVTTPRALIWRRKFWEWNAGWMGLGLSHAITILITHGMKNMFGKPRPDLLSRCQPDLTRLPQAMIGGYGYLNMSSEWVLVTSDICLQSDSAILDDGFRSFPSGHASTSWAGLLYLTLFLCSKFAIALPFLPPRSYSQDPAYTGFSIFDKYNKVMPYYKKPKTEGETASPSLVVPIRNQAAAPPTWILVIALIPIAAAIYISSSRFSDFRHHGFDIITGSLIGIVCAWFSFRWYHLPIRQGAGWAWGARSRDRAWGIGVGVGSYVGTEGWIGKKAAKSADLEKGPAGPAGPLSAGLDGEPTSTY